MTASQTTRILREPLPTSKRADHFSLPRRRTSYLRCQRLFPVNIITDKNDLRDAQVFTQKELMRASFLSNPLATEEDFERLWPRLFDEMLCLQAHDVHRQVMDALIAQLDQEERQQEEEGKK